MASHLKIIAGLGNPEEREKMREYCRQISQERHSIEGLVDRIEAAYEEVLKGRQ